MRLERLKSEVITDQIPVLARAIMRVVLAGHA